MAVAAARSSRGLGVRVAGRAPGAVHRVAPLRRESGDGATAVLVFEDLHWADDSLLAFLEYLAEWSQGVPLLLLCAARPSSTSVGRRGAPANEMRRPSASRRCPIPRRRSSSPTSRRAWGSAVSSSRRSSTVQAEIRSTRRSSCSYSTTAPSPGTRPSTRGLPDTVHALIAARLDTLSPERKSLLQDAAVVGKVFWAGAVRDIGGRDATDVDLALHELTLKELVRPVRTSSMEGRASTRSRTCSSVTSRIRRSLARSERGATQPPSGSSERRRARVEDLAEVLAHHYLQALDLARAAGEGEQADDLAARRTVPRARRRARARPRHGAGEARLARALALTPAGHPDRPDILRLGRRRLPGRAAAGRRGSAGRSHPVTRRASGDRGHGSRASAPVGLAQRLGEGRQIALAAEAVRLLEQQRPGPALVSAYAQLANTQMVAGAYDETIAAADRAEALARSSASQSLHVRSGTVASRARIWPTPTASRKWSARSPSSSQEEPAGTPRSCRTTLQSPATRSTARTRSLADVEMGVAFCQERGLAEPGAQIESNSPSCSRSWAGPRRLSPSIAAARGNPRGVGDSHSLGEPRSVEVMVRLARGERVPPAEVDWLVELARTVGAVDTLT